MRSRWKIRLEFFVRMIMEVQQLECHYTDEISINVIAIEKDDDDFFRGED